MLASLEAATASASASATTSARGGRALEGSRSDVARSSSERLGAASFGAGGEAFPQATAVLSAATITRMQRRRGREERARAETK